MLVSVAEFLSIFKQLHWYCPQIQRGVGRGFGDPWAGLLLAHPASLLCNPNSCWWLHQTQSPGWSTQVWGKVGMGDPEGPFQPKPFHDSIIPSSLHTVLHRVKITFLSNPQHQKTLHGWGGNNPIRHMGLKGSPRPEEHLVLAEICRKQETQRWTRPRPQQNNFHPGKIKLFRILWDFFRQSLRNSWLSSSACSYQPYQGITLWCLSCVCTKSQQHLSQSINREDFLSTQHPPLLCSPWALSELETLQYHCWILSF